jgi:hypothetical protein
MAAEDDDDYLLIDSPTVPCPVQASIISRIGWSGVIFRTVSRLEAVRVWEGGEYGVYTRLPLSTPRPARV